MTSPTVVPVSWEAVRMTAVERFVWVRAGFVAVALVGSPLVGRLALGAALQQQIWLSFVAAVTYVLLVRTLVGSIIGGAGFGWLLVWIVDIPVEMGPESFAYLAPLVPFAAAVPFALLAGLEWVVVHEPDRGSG